MLAIIRAKATLIVIPGTKRSEDSVLSAHLAKGDDRIGEGSEKGAPMPTGCDDPPPLASYPFPPDVPNDRRRESVGPATARPPAGPAGGKSEEIA